MTEENNINSHPNECQFIFVRTQLQTDQIHNHARLEPHRQIMCAQAVPQKYKKETSQRCMDLPVRLPGVNMPKSRFIKAKVHDQSHDAACSAADTDRKTRVQILKQNMQQHDDGKDTAVASDIKAKLIALGRELARGTLLPIIRDLCVQRLSKIERYPMPGPVEPVDDGVNPL